MNIKKVIIISVILAVLSSPAFAKKRHHTDGLNQVGDTCELLTCMAGKLQGDTQPACQPINQRFFNVRVFTPYYNPEATARVRQSVFSSCEGTAINKDELEMIIQRYGRSFQE
ncbi:TPA: hypothetical protein ACGP6H_004775 [Escherichia coli]